MRSSRVMVSPVMMVCIKREMESLRMVVRVMMGLVVRRSEVRHRGGCRGSPGATSRAAWKHRIRVVEVKVYRSASRRGTRASGRRPTIRAVTIPRRGMAMQIMRARPVLQRRVIEAITRCRCCKATGVPFTFVVSRATIRRFKQRNTTFLMRFHAAAHRLSQRVMVCGVTTIPWVR